MKLYFIILIICHIVILAINRIKIKIKKHDKPLRVRLK
jgi:hypothetical protein